MADHSIVAGAGFDLTATVFDPRAFDLQRSRLFVDGETFSLAVVAAGGLADAGGCPASTGTNFTLGIFRIVFTAALAGAECDPLGVFDLSFSCAGLVQCGLENPLRNGFTRVANHPRLILLLAAISPAGMGGVWLLARLMKGHWTGQESGWIGAYLFSMAGALYWLFNAPDLRFGYGWVILLIALPLAGLMSRLVGGLQGSPELMVKILLGVGMLAVHLYFLTASFEGRTFSQRWLLPPDYPLHATVPCPLENGTVLCAGEESYTQCYYHPFPCIPKPIEGVEMRGTDWGDGFRAVSVP